LEDLRVDGNVTCNEYAFCTANMNSVPSRLAHEQRDFVAERSYKEKETTTDCVAACIEVRCRYASIYRISCSVSSARSSSNYR
jgi:hypothetical protein